MKKLLIALLTILTLQPALGMDNDKKRLRVEDPTPIEDIDEISPDQNLAVWFVELNAYNANLDVTGVRLQLAQHEEAKKVTPAERDGLFDKASERSHKVSIMQRLGACLAENTTDNSLLQKFSFDQEARQAEKIKNLFYAFKLLNG